MSVINSTDPAVRERLARCRAVTLGAAAEMLQAFLDVLPAERHQTLDAFIAGGGWIGIETLTDQSRSSRVLLVGVEREGARRVFAETKIAEPVGVQ